VAIGRPAARASASFGTSYARLPLGAAIDGWPQRQVTGEALAQGAIGGLLGAALGVGGAALIGAIEGVGLWRPAQRKPHAREPCRRAWEVLIDRR
jgi:hypothetical protein